MITRLASLLCMLVLGGLLAACGGTMSDSGSSDRAAVGANAEAANDSAVEAVKPADVAKAAAGQPESTSGATPVRLVRTAEITVEVKDVAAAARTVRTGAVTLGGVVSTENTRFPDDDAADNDGGDDVDQEGASSEITLRVPEPKMDEALNKVAGVGREVNRSTTSDDVTATIVDLDSRVASQTKSVARVRELLDRASSLEDVVLLESELSQRESELESIQARQRALVDKAALATVNVTLRSSGTVIAEPEEAGFVAGFDGGWSALKASTTVVLTVLGALLPIAVVLAIIGIPAYAARRRFFPHSRTAEAPAGAPAGGLTVDPEPDAAPAPAP